MCGINGIFGKKEIKDIYFRINNMNLSISHRGPDDSGEQIYENKLAFGHRRLSIIDTSTRANQPMTSNSGRYSIVFNGEIYNYLDLKKDLDYYFKTSSDTEVILAYIEQYGINEFVNKCNGMYAFAIYDSVKKDLLLVRDRMGIKPLFYYIDDNYIVFSSEIKAILSSGLVDAEFNDGVIDDYLSYRYVREPNTFFKNIYQLEAGHIMHVNNKLQQTINKYWELPKEFNVETSFDEEIISKRLEKKLTNAITKRMMSDVPLGTYLSGGVDSSLITAVTQINTNEKLNTYTIGFEELNEFKYAKLVSQKYKTNHHQISINTDNYFDLMQDVILIKDAPLSVPNEIPLAKMSKVLKEKITVVLSGEGADELFGGYGRIFRSAFDYKNSKEEINTFFEYFINKYEYVPRILRDKYLNCDLSLRNKFDKKIQKEFDQKPNEENIFRFFHKYHIKGLLNRLDATTMLASVEARVPFLDHELIEFTYKEIPYNLKLKWKDKAAKQSASKNNATTYSEMLDIPKYILKKISYNYLPPEIIERKKMGFPVPLNEWLLSLQEQAKSLLKDAFWLKDNTIKDIIEDSKENERAGQILWMFINVELFRKLYFNKNWRY